MNLEISAAVLLVLLTTKELAGAAGSARLRRAAVWLYIPIVPMMALFVTASAARLAEILA
ncbi:MAG: hypothetical protein HYX96_08930 [Chloroflexi bacterium]|nr:hypothetical protein [Chloroflexota bacterium]